MKHILLFLSLSIFSFNVFSQCTEPVVESWHFTNPGNVNIAFNAQEDTEAYQFIFSALYTNSGPMPGTATATFGGTATAGINEVSINPTQILDFTVTAARYFYKVSLLTSCGDDLWSDTVNFYVSPYSMRNNPGFQCAENQYSPISILPDTGGDPFLFTFEVEQETAPDLISNLGILVDIGHTFNGDLSMSLISPSGTEVDLINHPNVLAGSSGLSMFFADNGADLNPQNQLGIFAPAQPLSVLNGESPVGTWTLSVIDNLEDNYGLLYGVCLNFDYTPCAASVSGLTYFDLNGNGLKGQDEPVFPYAHIHDATSGGDIYSDSQGMYYGCLSQNNNVLQLSNLPEYYTISPSSVTPIIPLGGYKQNVNFGVVPQPDMIDLEIKIWQSEPVLVGQTGKFVVEYKNVGTVCTQGAAFEIELNESLTITNIDMADVIITGNTATISSSENICPYQSQDFEISFIANSGLSNGDVLHSDVSITGLAFGLIEQSFSNNSATLQSAVTNDTDLNFKTVRTDTITSWFVISDEPIDYLIRFQNTSPESIQQMHIVDALDENLDLSTFKIESVSHPMLIEQEGNLFTFTFNDIALPASANDEEGSRGFLRYSAQPKSTIAAGAIIENTASLFFGALPGMQVNMVTTILIESTGLDKYDFNASVYPNPASTQIEVLAPANAKIAAVVVYDISGKRIESFHTGNSERFIIDVSVYDAGAYILRFESGKLIAPLLWIKE